MKEIRTVLEVLVHNSRQLNYVPMPVLVDGAMERIREIISPQGSDYL
ncbi:hypothetical protein LEP1GSC185_0957 [Leptospira licerasiae serovar Varillal str. VAR 010]|uniref:Uncharacterized protein n=1 Tax=Leptospira licerasiae str. MMD4847 TaxID=1049971 RepID=A0ABN0HD17_9LEPT|nr:hypothetical protein LEP1GSC185_0957 [Leptospira licerasiae serovar Varillal str. VAR 010]EJZ43412.1 hypothetical protein LEP1GSC178_3590 [Leptospira licerasiae str. MMD4847]